MVRWKKFERSQTDGTGAAALIIFPTWRHRREAGRVDGGMGAPEKGGASRLGGKFN